MINKSKNFFLHHVETQIHDLFLLQIKNSSFIITRFYDYSDIRYLSEKI